MLMTDGFDERAIGAGLSFPIPLPAPLGRTNRGQIQAANARVRQTRAVMDATSRDTLTEVAVALHEWTARREALEAYPDAAMQRARDNMADVTAEIESGRLGVRDALLVQQALLTSLLRRASAEHELALASIDLARAIGLNPEGDRS
jgi:outer membrane protein, heavy metal efflux system